jgi:hypothetical protein
LGFELIPSSFASLASDISNLPGLLSGTPAPISENSFGDLGRGGNHALGSFQGPAQDPHPIG